MIYRRLDENGDYTFGQSRQNFISGSDAVAQAILTRLKLFLGEWWEDTTDGLPVFQRIAGHYIQSKDAVDLIIRNRILGTPGVTLIQSFESSFDSQTRTYSFNGTVNTIYGPLTLENESLNPLRLEVS